MKTLNAEEYLESNIQKTMAPRTVDLDSQGSLEGVFKAILLSSISTQLLDS